MNEKKSKITRIVSQVLISVAFAFLYGNFLVQMVGGFLFAGEVLFIIAIGIIIVPFLLLVRILQYKCKISLYIVIGIFCFFIYHHLTKLFWWASEVEVKIANKPQGLLSIIKPDVCPECHYQNHITMLLFAITSVLLIHSKNLSSYYNLKKIKLI